MDTNFYKLRILSLLKTKAESVALAETIESLSDVFGKIEESYEQQITKVLDYQTLALVKEDCQNLNLSLSKQSDLETYINLVKQAVGNLKTLKLTLALSPSQELIDEIYSWINQNLSPDIIIDIKVEQSLIAGSLIEFEGKYKDLSIRTKLETYFSANPKLLAI
jgi:F0F1-type ATP synthase delta subunit